MSEKEWDSSVNEYIEEYKSSSYVKNSEWDMAIGLQQVDNLKPSKYGIGAENVDKLYLYDDFFSSFVVLYVKAF